MEPSPYTKPKITKKITHAYNINPSITLPAIPAVAFSGMGAVALAGVPFNVFTMLGIVLTSFFGPFILGMFDRGYAYSYTISELTRGDYHRLSQEAWKSLHIAVKSGYEQRVPLQSLTGDERDSMRTLIVQGKRFQLEEREDLAPADAWEKALDDTEQVYQLEGKG